MKKLLKTTILVASICCLPAWGQLSNKRNAIKYDFDNRVYAKTCISSLKLENKSELNEKIEDQSLKDLISAKLKKNNNLIILDGQKSEFDLSVTISQEVVDNGDKVRSICKVEDLTLKVTGTEVLLNKASSAEQNKVKKNKTEIDALNQSCDEAISKAISKMISCTIKR